MAKKEHGLGFTCRQRIFSILDNLIAILLQEKLNFNCAKKSSINKIKKELSHFSAIVLASSKNLSKSEAKIEATKIVEKLICSLPKIKEILSLDIEAAFAGDPAAKTNTEVILSYPFIEAIATHRVAHLLHELGLPIIPRILSERAHSRTGIDIHPGAKIEAGFFIDHGTGVVIGETTTIGKNVIIYQGVTLGALSPFDKKGVPLRDQKRHPNIEDDVIIYANATILGGETTIGKGSIVGGNCWITKSVPPMTIVYHSSEMKLKSKEE